MRVDSLGASSSSSSAAAAAASGGVETQLSLKDEQHTVADIASFDGSDDPASQLTYGQETSLGGNVVWALRKRRQAAAQASIPAAAVAGAGKLQHQWAGSPNASSQDPTLLVSSGQCHPASVSDRATLCCWMSVHVPLLTTGCCRAGDHQKATCCCLL